MATVPPVRRRKLPDEREAVTHKFSIHGYEAFVTVGMYEDGTPGEIFIVAAKEGSIIAGLMKSFGIVFSLALQYGVPLEALVEKLSDPEHNESGHEPSYPASVVGHVMRWLASKFMGPAEVHQPTEPLVLTPATDLAVCPKCGCSMRRVGTCVRCTDCDFSEGCG